MTLIALLIVLAIPLVNAQTRPSTSSLGKAVFSPKTGDALMDQHLQEIDRYGQAEFPAFKKALASKFSGSRREISRIYPKDKIEPGDIFIEPGEIFIEPGEIFIEPGEIFIEPGEIFKPGKDQGSLLARPGDVYYACALSSVTGKPAATIINSFARNQDWGVITRDLGIRPGSKEYETLQGIVLGGIGNVPGKTVGAIPAARPSRRR
jgi:hypothetical protein